MRRVGEILKQFLAGKLSGEAERTVELVTACKEILGDAGRHARVRDVRASTLVLEVDHPGWGQLVALRKTEILRLLAQRFPEMHLGELRVVVGSGGSSGGAERRHDRSGRRLPAGVDTGPSQSIEIALADVHDEALKRSLRALYEEARGVEERHDPRQSRGSN